MYDASFSPDGRRVITAGGDRTARVYDARTGEQEAVLRGHTARLSSARFNRRGTRAVTSAGDGTVRVWDVENGTELGTIGVHGGPVNSASFTHDGKCFLTASDDGSAKISECAACDRSMDELLAVVDESVGRKLTAEEWQTYIDAP